MNQVLKVLKQIVCIGGNFFSILGHLGQSIKCLAADTCLTAYSGVASLIPAWSHTFMESDHEIISKAIHSLELIQEGLFSVSSESMCTSLPSKNWLSRHDHSCWLGRKESNQTKTKISRPKLMLCVLIRTISMKWFLWMPQKYNFNP